MAIEVITKDCSTLSDTEFVEMSELEAAGGRYEIGQLSKQADDWVLNSQARRDGQLRGFVYSTLERIGGTPAVVLGLASVSDEDCAVLRALMHDQFHKARMAFPDEDVVVAARVVHPDALLVLSDLQDVRPEVATRANGEERAWGRRLAARYKAQNYDDRSMVAELEGPLLTFDFDAKGAGASSADQLPLFDACASGAHVIVAWGWAMAEFLDGFQQPAS